MREAPDEIDLRTVDLNLLVVFAALMRERSVRRAAGRLGLGPPAVSMALGRLRELFGDRLLVRAAGGMAPTPRALALHELVGPPLRALRGAVFDAPAFDPARAERTLRFASPDDLEVALLPRLLALVRREAPGVRLVLRPADFRAVPRLLDDGEAELALTATPARVERRHRRARVYEEGFVALFDPARVGAAGPLSLEQYVALPHLLVSPSGVFRGPIDDALAALGRRRRVAAALAHFSTLPFALKKTAALANVPAVAAAYYAKAFRLARSPLPFEAPRFQVSLLWHARHDADPALAWFRRRVRALVRRLRERAPA